MSKSDELFPQYHKIHGVYKRDDRGRFILGDWAKPEFGCLAGIAWRWTEKVDGMNIRVRLTPDDPPAFAGRTCRATLHKDLEARLRDRFPDVLRAEHPITLHGEGYGAGIQKGGGRYSDAKDFILFDVESGGFLLEPDDMQEVARTFGLDVVPEVARCSLTDMMDVVASGSLPSRWSGIPEGVVGTPVVQLFNRFGERVITKLKVKDFERVSAS